MDIFVINGLGGCGKSTFVKSCKKYCLSNQCVYELSTVDFVKEVARLCGWRGEKETKDRQFLHDLKEAMEIWNNVPNKKVIETIKALNQEDKNCCFFVNIREPKSIQDFIKRAKKSFGKEPKTIIITSKKRSNEISSISSEINNIKYDVIIDNSGTLKDLENIAKKFMYSLSI